MGTLNKKFHPRLFGFSGFSGAGKTTLIEKLIKECSDWRIGYVKHDAHKFEMDYPGKDTYRQYQAGAVMVYINDSSHSCLQVRGDDYIQVKETFKDCDMVLAEGHKYSDHPKFLFLDKEESALREFTEGKITDVLAFILQDKDQVHPSELPAFHRDDVTGIKNFIRERIKSYDANSELFALILTGGQSSRMGTDKSLLSYHGKPQAQHLYDLCASVNLKTFLSCTSEQAQKIEFNHLPIITDRFLGFGPMSGILSAMSVYPEKSWLVLACDLPLISAENLKELIKQRDPLRQATAYFNNKAGNFEPLFAIYGPEIYSRMLHFLSEGVTSLQKVLSISTVKKLALQTEGALLNANTLEDRAKALEILSSND